MSSAPEPYLEQIMANQQAMQQTVNTAYALQTRYVFVPFRDRELTLNQMENLGGLPEIRAGKIIPITKYSMLDLDYSEMLEVPRDYDGNFQMVNEGVSRNKLIERPPQDVVAAIFDTFNKNQGVPGSADDNGICEIEVLRGSDDMVQCLALNRYCLPGTYKTAREQMAQLENARINAPSTIFASVAARLMQATRQAVIWAEWHYENLTAAMEDKDRSGKRRLSPLDVDVCKWIEKPNPRFKTNLAGDQQTVVVQGQIAAQPPPTVQHKRCGTFLNLVDGQPPAFCHVCREAFGEEPQVVAPVATEAEQKEFLQATGESKLEREQREARDRNNRRR